MWKGQWFEPPRTSEELWMWKVYCRIWNDIKLPSPGTWIYMWMKNDVVSSLNEDEMYAGTEALRWYILECKE